MLLRVFGNGNRGTEAWLEGSTRQSVKGGGNLPVLARVVAAILIVLEISR